MTETIANVRPVAEIVDSIETLEGGGFLVHRPFPIAALDMKFTVLVPLGTSRLVNSGPPLTSKYGASLPRLAKFHRRFSGSKPAP